MHNWIGDTLGSSSILTRDVVLQLRLDMPDHTKSGSHGSVINKLMQRVFADDHFALDLVELMLESEQVSPDYVSRLEGVPYVAFSGDKITALTASRAVKPLAAQARCGNSRSE